MLCSDCQKMFSVEGKPFINYHTDNKFTEGSALGGSIHKSMGDLEKAANQRCQICEPLWKRILAKRPANYKKPDGGFEMPTILSFEHSTSIFSPGVLQIRHRRMGGGPHVFPDQEAQLVLWPLNGKEEKNRLEITDQVGGHNHGVEENHGSPKEEAAVKFEIEVKEEELLSDSLSPEPLAVSSLDLTSLEPAKYWPQVFKWIQECEHKHDVCSRRSATGVVEWYPTRLLDLDAFPEEPGKIQVCLSADTKPKGSYMTLSHRWGLNSIFTLTAENQEALMQSIPLAILPKTFVEAIEVTRKLGVRYLWIDSLCIMQSGEGSKDDWEKESAEMHEIYNHSYCNIAATAAVDPTVGLFFERPTVQAPTRITIKWNGYDDDLRWKDFHGEYTIIDANIWATQVTLSPLMQRAWVFQERILAPRVLHFAAEQLLWECGTLQASENYPNGLPELSQTILDRDYRPSTRNLLWTLAPRAHPRFTDIRRPPPPMLDDRVAHYYGHHGMWNTMVEDYMRCKLTKEEDKLVAIGGVAQFWEQMTIQSDYRAGIRMKELPGALLWYCEPRPDSVYTAFRPKTYRAPSFCWASFEGPILFRQGPHNDPICDILELNIENINDNIFGQVRNGFIRMSGFMREGYSMAGDHGDSEDLYISRKEEVKEFGGFCYPDELALLNYDRDRGEHVFRCFAVTKTLGDRGDHFVTGLMLESTGADNEYKRIGLFLIGGDEASEFCTTGEKKEIIII